MHRNAVFVDAGYVYSQSAVSLTGSNCSRSNLKLDEAEIVNQLKSIALGASAGAQLLRIYWYDGARNGMTVEQLVLADMPDVKVRLGSINSAGQQKGVDSLLVTDLIDLARNGAISDALVVTGDGDMRIAVQIAQSFGVRVHLVGLEPSSASQSTLLRQEADTVHEISKLEVAKFMRCHLLTSPLPVLPATSVPASSPGDSFEKVIARSLNTVLVSIPQEEVSQLKQIIATTRRIPEQYDRRILGTCRALLQRDLDDSERRAMRNSALLFIRDLTTPSS